MASKSFQNGATLRVNLSEKIVVFFEKNIVIIK